MLGLRIVAWIKVLAGCWMLFQSQVQAAEASLGISPVFWHYEEFSSQRSGYASTPFTSRASGWGLRGHLSLEEAWENHPSWSVRVDASGMLPLGRAEEVWRLAGGASSQSNRLDIRETEGRAALLCRFGRWQAGIWGNYRWQQQRRSRFIVNGSPVTLIGGPVRESITSAWAGVELAGRWESIRLRARAGMPVWMKMTNGQINGSFDRRAGYRLGGDVAIRLWNGENYRVDARISYLYQKIGGDLKPFGFWPENRYQTVSAGVAMRW